MSFFEYPLKQYGVSVSCRCVVVHDVLLWYLSDKPYSRSFVSIEKNFPVPALTVRTDPSESMRSVSVILQLITRRHSSSLVKGKY